MSRISQPDQHPCANHIPPGPSTLQYSGTHMSTAIITHSAVTWNHIHEDYHTQTHQVPWIRLQYKPARFLVASGESGNVSEWYSSRSNWLSSWTAYVDTHRQSMSWIYHSQWNVQSHPSWMTSSTFQGSKPLNQDAKHSGWFFISLKFIFHMSFFLTIRNVLIKVLPLMAMIIASALTNIMHKNNLSLAWCVTWLGFQCYVSLIKPPIPGVTTSILFMLLVGTPNKAYIGVVLLTFSPMDNDCSSRVPIPSQPSHVSVSLISWMQILELKI